MASMQCSKYFSPNCWVGGGCSRQILCLQCVSLCAVVVRTMVELEINNKRRLSLPASLLLVPAGADVAVEAMVGVEMEGRKTEC